MKTHWTIPVWDWRGLLDDMGVWPNDLAGKVACAGINILMVCLAAYYCPFTVDAFLAALMAYGVIIVLFLFAFGVATGVVAAVMGIYWQLAGESQSPVARSKNSEAQGTSLEPDGLVPELPQCK